jgi:hypothetical protein
MNIIRPEAPQEALVVKDTGELHNDLNATTLCRLFPNMAGYLDAIKEERTDMECHGINANMARKAQGVGRKIASLPPPVFAYIMRVAPQIMENPQLLRTFLREHEEFLVVDKSRI